MGDHERSLEYYQKAIQVDPSKPELYEGVGADLANLGRKEEAKAAFRKSLSLDPFRSNPHIELAHLDKEEGNLKEAIEEYESAFQLGETDLHEYTNLCTLYYSASEFEGSVACLKRVLAIDPRNKQAAQLLPYALQNVIGGGKDG